MLNLGITIIFTQESLNQFKVLQLAIDKLIDFSKIDHFCNVNIV